MSQEEQENAPAEAATKRRKFKVKFAPDGIEDNEEEAFAALQEKRRKTREKQYKLEASVDRNQEDLQDVNNSFFTDVMESLNEQHRGIMHVRATLSLSCVSLCTCVCVSFSFLSPSSSLKLIPTPTTHTSATCTHRCERRNKTLKSPKRYLQYS
jgi:hypothetical protein